MDHFEYRNGTLYAEDVNIPALAQAVGTPFYCYSSATLERHYNVMAEAFAEIPTTIHFAVKANSNIAVLATLAKLGAGADTVSEGEIRRAIAAGIPAEKIVYSGVGKSRNELAYALDVGVGQINVESAEELVMLSAVAVDQDVDAQVAIRVNPDVDAGSHDKISTGRKTDKFGIAWETARDVYAKAAALPGIEIVGITCHIGSQLTALEPFQAAFARVAELVEQLREDGHTIDVLDLGGGLGIPYNDETPPHPDDYAQMIIDTVQHLGCRLALEPGRLIAGNAGILVTSVILTKEQPERRFAVVDAAMNDLMRPAMYDAAHAILPVEIREGETLAYDVVGPVCETADRFARDVNLTGLREGDLLALRSAGAYGAVMASEYNSRLLIPEILVNNDAYSLIRARPTYDEMLARDTMPDWLK